MSASLILLIAACVYLAMGVPVAFALGLATAATWLIIAWFFRYSSLASLVAAVFAPVYYIFGDDLAWYTEKALLLAVVVMALLLVWRHAPNIARGHIPCYH